MNSEIGWPTYLRIVTDDEAGSTIAKKVGTSESTISRWLSGEVEPKPRQVVDLARAYGVHPLAALVSAGYLAADEVDLASITPRKLQIREFTELELAQEIVRRIEEGESSMLEAPLDEDSAPMANVSRLRNAPRTQEPLGAVAKEEKSVIDVPEFE